jgi:hypothetical protein
VNEKRVGETIKQAKIVLTTFGLVAAPMLGAMAATAFVLIYTLLTTWNGYSGGAAQVIAMGGLFGGCYGALPSLLVGWPIHLVMQRLNLTHALHYVTGGAVIAALEIMGIWVIAGAHGTMSSPLLLMFGAAGASEASSSGSSAARIAMHRPGHGSLRELERTIATARRSSLPRATAHAHRMHERA